MKLVRSISLLLSLLMLPVTAQEPTSDFPPKKFEASRYQAIWEKNPFVSEVVPVAAGNPEEEAWAKGLILKAVNRIQGKYVVHLEDTKLLKEKDPTKARARFQRLVEDAESPSLGGLTILQVKAHRDPRQVEVSVAFGDRDSTMQTVVKYDPKALVAKPVPRPGASRGRGLNAPPTTRLPAQARTANGQVPSAAQNNARAQDPRAGAQRGRRGGGQAGNPGANTQGQNRGGRRGGRDPRGQGGRTPERRVVLPPGR